MLSNVCSVFAQHPELELEDSASIEQVNKVMAARRDALISPRFLTAWVGASFFTKDNIENDCGVDPMAYKDGLTYYDFGKCPVGIEYNDYGVGVLVSFRMFGEDGYKFKRDLMAFGYKLHSKKKTTVIENGFSDVGSGTESIYKYKTKHGFSVCHIVEGQAMMFTFYRSQK